MDGTAPKCNVLRIFHASIRGSAGSASASCMEKSAFIEDAEFRIRNSGFLLDESHPIMKHRTLLILVPLILLAAVPAARAQNVPHIAYVLPAGCRQGATVEVKVGGQFLANASEALISGQGIQAALGEYTRPINAAQAMQMRDRVQELLKAPASLEVQKEIIDIRTRLLIFNAERNLSPVLAETVTLKIAIAADAEPGIRELRLATPQGLSNPLIFCISQLPEFSERESFNIQVPPGGNQPQLSQLATDMSITLPAVVNGRIKPGWGRPQVPARPGQPFTPGDVDRYRFTARRGQQLVIKACARDLMPYLADAVPGWFQATMALYDAQGKELAYGDDYRFHPDPVIHFVVPQDGEYVMEIRDALYRGREDFIYRIEAGELPFVTGVYPLGGHAGAKTTVQLTGWNLPADNLTLDATDLEPGVHPLFLHKSEYGTNRMPFMVEALPEVAERESNNTPNASQRVALPVIVNGRVDRSGDWDVFGFEGSAGQEIVAEVRARRLESPIDSVLRVTDAAGRQLAFNDDFEDIGAGLETHHADSWISLVLPASGMYFVHLGDAQQKGGPEHAYRLRISAPRPDFELRVVPSGVSAGAGQTIPITVHALRKDGFSGDIVLSLKGSPGGFVLSGAQVPAGQSRVRVTLTLPQRQQTEPFTVSLEGKALIQGREVRRLAIPAEDMMQAFAYRHLVPSESLKIAIRRGAAIRAPIRIAGAPKAKLCGSGTLGIPVSVQLPPNNPFAGILLELSEAPDGITLREMPPIQEMTEIVLQCDPAKAKAGLRGNLIINIVGERERPAAAGKGQPNRLRISLGTLPAIPFEIATLSMGGKAALKMNTRSPAMIMSVQTSARSRLEIQAAHTEEQPDPTALPDQAFLACFVVIRALRGFAIVPIDGPPFLQLLQHARNLRADSACRIG
jgi:hypothetical protein